MPFVNKPLVKIITGVRRCGKSTIMLMIMGELEKRGVSDSSIIRFNFDTLEWKEVTGQQVFEMIESKLVKNGRTYLFLDEIQEIESWEQIINTFMDEKKYDVDIFVACSNSEMVSSEIFAGLAVRSTIFHIYPFSFAEYLEFKKQNGEPSEPDKEFLKYVEYGGFPAVHLKPLTTDEVYDVIKDIYSASVFNDVLKWGQFRKVDQLEHILRFAFDNVGNTFSANYIKNFLKYQNRTIDVETVYSYLSKFESAYVLNRCLRLDIQKGEILKTQSKFYLADVALRHALLGYKKDDVPQLVENIVYLELRRCGYNVYSGKLDSHEIDFVAEKQGEIIYFQIAYLPFEIRKKERVFDNLLKIGDKSPKVLISKADVDFTQRGISYLNIKDFLLHRNF